MEKRMGLGSGNGIENGIGMCLAAACEWVSEWVNVFVCIRRKFTAKILKKRERHESEMRIGACVKNE